MSPEQNQPRGRRTSEMVKRLVENKLGVEVPSKTIEAWASLARMIRIADDLIDTEPNKAVRAEVYRNAIAFFSGETDIVEVKNTRLKDEANSLRSHLNSLPEERRECFLRNLNVLLKITEKIKEVESPRDLAKLTMLEGQVTALLFISLLPVEYYQQQDYHDYWIYFTRLSREVNAFDSLIDFAEDFNSKRIGIKPTLKNKAAYSLTTLSDLVYLAFHTSPNLIGSFIAGAKVITNDRFGNSAIHFT